MSELTAALNSANSDARAQAAEQLSLLGKDARSAAVPPIREVGDEDESVSEYAMASLEEMGVPQVSHPDDAVSIAELTTRILMWDIGPPRCWDGWRRVHIPSLTDWWRY